jgi:hypothetical protein
MKFAFAVITLGLAGCASAPPTNPDPKADFYADRWDCQKQVAGLPRTNQAPIPAEKTDTVTQCVPSGIPGGGVVCRSTEVPAATGMSAVDSMFRTMAQVDAARAANAPREAVVSCMRAKGWR